LYEIQNRRGIVVKNDNTKNVTTGGYELRRHAEERLQVEMAELHSLRTEGSMQQLVHELEVHHIELEMQNDELLHVNAELELSRNRYYELYDFAPVGYFTFDSHGVIQEVNLAGAHLLEKERNSLINKPLANFIADADERTVFSNHISMVLKRKVLLKCAVRVTIAVGKVIHWQLNSIAINSNNRDGLVLTTIVDSTLRKEFEEKLKHSHDNLEGIVQERTSDLTASNRQLTHEIEERKKAEESLLRSFAEIKQLKDRLRDENTFLQQEAGRQFNFGEIVGQSPPLAHIFKQIEQVAPMNATVLLLGETGTGKGVVARAIHRRSARKNQALITVDCTTLPATLVESELFGRERGAFTGSDTKQIGRFELADGGTIFLDEIGEMPLELQSKLLRVIQDGEFERLGSPRTMKTNVRIIAATNRNLAVAIRNGTFREDLFYRLNVFPITMPPLRQHKEDIPLLVNHFVVKFNTKIGKKIETVSKDTLNALQEYHWPGNVRELESVIERAVIISQGSALQVLDRFDTLRKPDNSADQDVKALAELEHDHILQVLQKTGWRIEGKTGAALILGLNASTLRARMRKFGIVR
jgi:PAS domain S-box-containing protein